MTPLESFANRAIAWFEREALRCNDMEKNNRGRFNALADSCKADAKNYLAMAADGRKALIDCRGTSRPVGESGL